MALQSCTLQLGLLRLLSADITNKVKAKNKKIQPRAGLNSLHANSVIHRCRLPYCLSGDVLVSQPALYRLASFMSCLAALLSDLSAPDSRLRLQTPDSPRCGCVKASALLHLHLLNANPRLIQNIKKV